MSSPRTVAFHTLGCKLNFSESSTLARSLEEAGYAKVRQEERPDVFVLNTCSVTENADKECRRHVRRFQGINPDAFIAVVGCYAQLKPEEIAAIPGVDLVLGANEKFDLAAHIEACHSAQTSAGSLEEDPAARSEKAAGSPRASGDPAKVKEDPLAQSNRTFAGSLEEDPAARSEKTAGSLRTSGDPAKMNGLAIYSPIKELKHFVPSYNANDRTRTFLKVQDGCDYFCSFCTIPLARGRSRSATIAETVDLARTIAASGVKEIVLTGVNTGDFGRAHDQTFLQLIEALDEVEGIDRFRISSIEPNLCHDGVIDFVAGSKRFAPHFHIPLQSGSDAILQRMRRRYDTALYAERVARIKERMPHACIGVDVITGTPGESEEEFLKTHEFLRTIPVDYLHVFTYSERANTTAVRMDESVPMETRRERTKQLRILSNKLQRAFYQKHLGTTRTVLFEAERVTATGSLPEDPAVPGSGAAGSLHSSGDPAEVFMLGFTDNYLRVTMPYDPEFINRITPVALNNIDGDGHIIGSLLQLQIS